MRFSYGLALLGSLFVSSQSSVRAQTGTPVAKLSWPFLPGETWHITRSWGTEGAHTRADGEFALDLQRSDPSGRRWSVVTESTPIHAAGAGVVLKVVNPTDAELAADVSHARFPYGRYIDIDHGNGIGTRYAHLKEVRVRPGQHLERRDTIGLAGNTGNSHGAHLHFEVRRIVGGKMATFVNPESVLDLAPGTRLASISLETTGPRAIAIPPLSPEEIEQLGTDIAAIFSSPKKESSGPTTALTPAPKTADKGFRLIPEALAAEPEHAAGLPAYGLQFDPPTGWALGSSTTTERVYMKGRSFIRIGLQPLPGSSPVDISNAMFRMTARTSGKTSSLMLPCGTETLAVAWGTWVGKGRCMEHVILPRGGRYLMVSTDYGASEDRDPFLKVVYSLTFTK